MSGSTPSQNSRKNARIPVVDRISNLPDDIISHILSNLPIKDAVRTCVLSKSWEFKWYLVCNLDIVDMDFCYEPWAKGNQFPNTVNKILLHLNNVKSFRLECACYKPILIASWISAVLGQQRIESVDLKLYDNFCNHEFVLPRSLLSCTSLRELVVHIENCTFKVPVNSCFQNLRSLELTLVKIVNEHSGNTVAFTFPVLETLKLDSCEWLKVKYVEFFAPSLTVFKISNAGDDVDHYSIKVIGSRLAEFCLSCVSLGDCVLTDTTVVSAFLECPWSMHVTRALGEYGFRVRMILRQISSSQYVELSGFILKAIIQSKIRLSLLRFSELKELHVLSHVSSDISYDLGVDGLLEILHASPFLEVLNVYVDDLDEYDYDAIESVPSCILSHLKELRLCYFNCETPQFRLEKFLLKNAFQLKYVLLSSCHYLKRDGILQQLSEFPKGSKCVTIEAKV